LGVFPIHCLFIEGVSCANFCRFWFCLFASSLFRKPLHPLAQFAAANCSTSAPANSSKINSSLSTLAAISPPSPKLALLCLQAQSTFLTPPACPGFSTCTLTSPPNPHKPVTQASVSRSLAAPLLGPRMLASPFSQVSPQSATLVPTASPMSPS